MVGTPLVQSRPAGGAATPFTCSDLGLCSIADLGFRAHYLLTALAADDHAQYALLAGRAGGQALSGGLASPDTLTLRPYPAAIAGILTLSNVSPQAALTGNLDVSGHLALGPGASIAAAQSLRVVDTLAEHPCSAGYFMVTGNRPSGPQFTYGIAGGAVGQGTPTSSYIYGLYFYAQYNNPNACPQLGGVLVQVQSGASGTGALQAVRVFHASAAYWGGSKPEQTVGLEVEELGGAGTATAHGFRCADQTATTVRLLELGPVTPYLRLLGGGNPPANQSNLSLKLGATLKQITEYDVDTAGGGYRALRVPN